MKTKLVLLLCVTMFGAFLDWLLGLPTSDRPQRDWPHLHRSAQINESNPQLIAAIQEGSLSTFETKNGNPPVKWPDGIYKIK